jgi:hypothetical protein
MTDSEKTPSYEGVDHVHIALTQGLFAKVSPCDFDRVNQFKWNAQIGKTNNYARRGVWLAGKNRSRCERMHNFILGIKWIDHLNGDGLDNRRENLRAATNSQNCANTRKLVPRTSKFKGVYWDGVNSKWSAQVSSGNKKRLGRFKEEIDAARAYDMAAIDAWGEFANTNFQASEYSESDRADFRNRKSPAQERASRQENGICFYTKRWHVELKYRDELGNQIRFRPVFMTKMEAGLAYDAKAREVFGSAAILNYPEIADV